MSECEICEALKQNKVWAADADYTVLEIWKDGEDFILSAYGDDTVSILVSYCPICGRSLDDD